LSRKIRLRRQLRNVIALGLILLPCLASCRFGTKASGPKPEGSPKSSIQAQTDTAREISCRLFVQNFYDWYEAPVVPSAVRKAGQLSSDDVIQLKPGLFSDVLLNLLQQDREAQAKAKGDLVGLDFDPFYNSQDPSPKFQVQSVHVQGDHCRAVVRGVDAGQLREDVEPELKAETGRWVFVNFHYDPGSSTADVNLVDQLLALRAERGEAKKKGAHR